MKKVLIWSLMAVSLFLLFNNMAFAEVAEPLEVANLFTWARKTPVDWSQGALYAGLGLIGALVTVFGLIGGAVPGTAGQAKIEEDRERLARLSQQLEHLITEISASADAVAGHAQMISVVESTVNNLRDDLRAERWRQFVTAAILYAFLGAFFSALLAQNMLQSLVISAGWTSFLGTWGLKKDYEVRRARKNNVLEETVLRAQKLEESLEQQGTTYKDLGFEPFEELERDVRTVQKL